MRRLFPITHEWVKWREAILIEQEDAAIREARDGATGEERVFLDALLDLRRRNARGEKAS